MPKSILFALLMISTSAVMAEDCANFAGAKAEIQTKTLPKLESIRKETDLKNRIEFLRDELIDSLSARLNSDFQDYSQQVEQAEKLKVLLYKISVLIGRNDVDSKTRKKISSDMDAILDRQIWNAKMVISELDREKEACQIQSGEAKYDSRWLWGLRTAIYGDRVGVINWIPNLYSHSKYAISVSDLSSVVNVHEKKNGSIVDLPTSGAKSAQ